MKSVRGLIVAAMALGMVGAAWAEDLVGQWGGSLKGGDGAVITVGLKVTKGADGKLAGVASSSQAPDPIPMDVVTDGSKLTATAASIGGKYEGAWDDASKTWKGTWTQNGQAQPLALSRKS